VLDLSRIKVDTKQKIKDFNQTFHTLMKKIPHASKPAEDVSIEFYTLALLVSKEMFVKTTEKDTLEATFKEAIKIEKYMLSLKGNHGVECSKDKSNPKTKANVTSPLRITKIQTPRIWRHSRELWRNSLMKLLIWRRNMEKVLPTPRNFSDFNQKGKRTLLLPLRQPFIQDV